MLKSLYYFKMHNNLSFIAIWFFASKKSQVRLHSYLSINILQPHVCSQCIKWVLEVNMTGSVQHLSSSGGCWGLKVTVTGYEEGQQNQKFISATVEKQTLCAFSLILFINEYGSEKALGSIRPPFLRKGIPGMYQGSHWIKMIP